MGFDASVEFREWSAGSIQNTNGLLSEVSVPIDGDLLYSFTINFGLNWS